LTALLPFDESLIGNPFLPALHGGVTSAFLEMTAIIELSWSLLWDEMEEGKLDPTAVDRRTPATSAQDHRFYRRLPALGPAARCLCAGADQPLGPALRERPCRGLAGQPRAPLRPGDRAFSGADPQQRPFEGPCRG
jgi:hypothetical protein